MKVPAITVDDMLDFHQRHFPSAPAPAGFFSHQQSRHENRTYVADISTDEGASKEDPEDDGLGYYEDGVKRTLTDDEISIFRHSEVQRLYARLLEQASEAAERKLADLEALSKSNEPSEEGEYEPQSDPTAATIVAEKVEEERPAEERKRSELKQEVEKDQGSEHRLSPQVTNNDAQAHKNGPKKRKRSDEPEHHTYRRIAREMDDVKAVNVELDY
ncbi:hypothetical protein IWX49DRAFT_588072 [Phyllosticta citricarpa]|uniref:Uncharacterized protein n=2 Tax=Phyllosticta TaxID=121621 RepID=A0ABR1L723_9PEZI